MSLLIVVLLYRSFNTIILVGVTGVTAVLASVATINLLQQNLTIISLSLPLIAIIIAIADAIHILNYHKSLKNNESAPENKSLLKGYLPCFKTSITTAVGVGSFAFSDILPLHFFSISAFVACLVVYFYTMLTIWLWLTLIPCGFDFNRQSIKKIAGKTEQVLNKVTLHKKPILISFVAITALTLLTLSNIKTETNMLDVFFAKNSQTYQNFDKTDKNFGGIGNVSIILKAKRLF